MSSKSHGSHGKHATHNHHKERLGERVGLVLLAIIVLLIAGFFVRALFM